MVYGYCRVSTSRQRINRQVNNIKNIDSNAVIIKEFYTGTVQSRPLYEKMLNQLQAGDTIIFDSVSRMSRNADEGYKDYKMLYDKKINLIFINEPLINTEVLENSKKNMLKIAVETGNQAVDNYFKGNISLINDLLLALAEEQIKQAFIQSQKEVDDLHTRISQGMRESKNNGVTIGRTTGTKITTKKSIEYKKTILKHAKDFGGSLKDEEIIKLLNCARNTYYKYKNELKKGI